MKKTKSRLRGVSAGLVMGAVCGLTVVAAAKRPARDPEAVLRTGQSVLAATFSPDGRLLATSSRDNTVKLWDTSRWQLRHTLKGYNDRVDSIIFTPDSKLLATGSGDATVKLWDVSSRKLLLTLPGHEAVTRRARFV